MAEFSRKTRSIGISLKTPALDTTMDLFLYVGILSKQTQGQISNHIYKADNEKCDAFVWIAEVAE